MKIYNMWEHTGWGNSINFFDWDTRRISGHTPFKIKIGDEIRQKMVSGKIGRFKVINIDYKLDPSDMFFGTVEDLDYL